MCLAIPGTIIDITDEQALIDYGGVTKRASLRLFPEAKPGDCALVHAGFVIQLMDDAAAKEMEQVLLEMQGL